MKYCLLLMLCFFCMTPVTAMRTRPIAQASEILAPESSSEESELLAPNTPDFVSESEQESTPDEPKKISSPGRKICVRKKPGFKKH